MSTDEYVPSDDQVRGRYCDGTYVQTGHTTGGDEFDAWLARVRRDAQREAEARIEAVRDLCDDADKRHASVLIVTKVRRALESVPPPSA